MINLTQQRRLFFNNVEQKKFFLGGVLQWEKPQASQSLNYGTGPGQIYRHYAANDYLGTPTSPSALIDKTGLGENFTRASQVAGMNIDGNWLNSDGNASFFEFSAPIDLIGSIVVFSVRRNTNASHRILGSNSQPYSYLQLQYSPGGTTFNIRPYAMVSGSWKNAMSNLANVSPTGIDIISFKLTTNNGLETWINGDYLGAEPFATPEFLFKTLMRGNNTSLAINGAITDIILIKVGSGGEETPTRIAAEQYIAERAGVTI